MSEQCFGHCSTRHLEHLTIFVHIRDEGLFGGIIQLVRHPDDALFRYGKFLRGVVMNPILF